MGTPIAPDEIISREEARQRGLPHYFTGIPCKHGHVYKWRTKTGHCVACVTAAAKKWNERNLAHLAKWKRDKRAKDGPEVAHEMYVAYRAKNGDRLRAQARERASHQRKELYEENKKWRDKNPDKVREYSRRSRQKPGATEKAREATRKWRAANREHANALKSAQYHKDIEKSRKQGIVNAANRKARKRGNGGSFTHADVRRIRDEQCDECAACGAPHPRDVDHIMPLVRGGSSDPSNLQILCKTCNFRKYTLHPMVWAAQNDYDHLANHYSAIL